MNKCVLLSVVRGGGLHTYIHEIIANACTRIKRTRILTYHIHWSQGHWYIHSYFMEWYVICFRASWRLNVSFLKTAFLMIFSIPTVSHISMSLSSNSECYQFMPFSVPVKELIFLYINQVIYNYKGFFLNYGVAGKFMGSLYLSVFLYETYNIKCHVMPVYL